MKLILNNQDITGIVERGSITIEDPMESVCRKLKFKPKKAGEFSNQLGQTVTLEINGVTWYEGIVMVKGKDWLGRMEYTASDPAFYLAKNDGDYLFKQQTAKQIIASLAEKCGINAGTMADTGAVFPVLLYRGKNPSLIAVDVLARTRQANGKKFWYRYEPGNGLTVFERVLPENVWVFENRVNLTDAYHEETIEDQVTRVTMVNRETGKVITKEVTEKLHPGNVTSFEETDLKEAEATAEAVRKLAELSKVGKTMRFSGVNPGAMPMFWAGDPVYIDEPGSGLVGGYYMKNVTHTVIADNLILVTADVVKTLNLPDIQYKDATEAAKEKAAKTGSTKTKEPDIIDRYF